MAQITIGELEAMLADCIPGATIGMKTHNRVVYHPDGRTYPSLPRYDNMMVMHIRKLARFFKIFDCAKKHIQSL